MEGEKRNDTSLSRKRSFTFGAYGGVDKFTCGEEASRPESVQDNILDILDSPVTESKPFLSTSSNQRDTELFEIIEKLQGSRIDEQRCEFPLPLKSQILTIGGDLPLILPSESGGYWIDPPLERLVDMSPSSSYSGSDPESYDIMERDGEAKIYHEFFRSRYHHSFTAVDPALGPLVLSVCLEEEENKIRVILRMRECSLHGVFSVSLFPNIPSAVELAKMLCDRVTVAKFDVVGYLKAPDLITAFDEHRVSPNFKFGILYQKEGQLTEEDILSNNTESEEFKEFLSVLGETVELQGFTRFRGGLDVCHGQTGSEAVYTSFHGREIMFHVATKLPFTEGDPQQLQRKRHIGNDIVALVYQEGQTPFLSDVIKSHFLHCFLVVRRIQRPEEEDKTVYQVSVTAREDVPPFGPVLPDPPVFTERSLLREFLLTKLINAEISCYKAQRFSRLELRTRSSLLESLQTELSTRSQCMMGDPSLSGLQSSEGVRGVSEGSGGFIENFKRAIRVRSHSFETLGVPRKVAVGASQRPKAEKDGESDKPPGALPHLSDSSGAAELKDQASPQEET
ncbi:rap1 GTPase-activating protein 2 [Xyrichtys novacula]|uniref:Rap1 GTPase-activating protein 2 n=2 Tax=Xyrichtys novacula TaxID=13765 RepID=A0AAV1FNW5_XYRNO|nr:rap1 GTPase-activating protein 2 [Xyrichtys novacula]